MQCRTVCCAKMLFCTTDEWQEIMKEKVEIYKFTETSGWTRRHGREFRVWVTITYANRMEFSVAIIEATPFTAEVSKLRAFLCQQLKHHASMAL